MSKKSRKNSSNPPAKKAVAAISRTAAKKTARSVGKATTKKAAKKPATPPATKPAKTPVRTTRPAPTKATTKAGPPPAKPARVAKVSAVPAKPIATPSTRKPKSAPAAQTRQQLEPAVAAPAIAIEGALAPAFSLPSAGGGQITLHDYAGQKLVIFFYPRANTPGCTKEAIDFTRLAALFAAGKTAILGVSADPLKAQEHFREKYELGIPLLSDETHGTLEAYGAWGQKSMYGKVFQGILRTTVLIDQHGIVAKIWRNVKVDGHADAVLEVARSL